MIKLNIRDTGPGNIYLLTLLQLMVVEHSAPNGNSFTIQDMIIAIEVTERKSRGSSEWLGGIDVHHIYFEGIHQNENGDWEIPWGS